MRNFCVFETSVHENKINFVFVSPVKTNSQTVAASTGPLLVTALRHIKQDWNVTSYFISGNFGFLHDQHSLLGTIIIMMPRQNLDKPILHRTNPRQTYSRQD